MDINKAWLTEQEMADISRRPVHQSTREIWWRRRYVADCPSACYRGAATILSLVLNAVGRNLQVSTYLDELDRSLKASGLPLENDLGVGAFIALVNAGEYADHAPNLNILAGMLSAELVCTTQFYFENRRRGL